MSHSTTYSELSLRKKAAYILAFLALSGTTFVLGVWFMFPDASLERRINTELTRQVPFNVKIHRLERSFPFTLKGKQVDMDLPQLPITITRLKVKPAWSSLLQLQAGISASGVMFDGPFEILHTSSGATKIEAEKMHLSAAIPGFSSITVEADLEYVNIEGNISNAVTPHNGRISLKKVRILGLDKLGLGQSKINLGDMKFTLETRERRLEIELLNPNGAFQLSGSGSITPPRLTPTGRLNLQLRIGNIPPEHTQLEELLNLAGIRKDAAGYLIRLGGRLQHPFLR